MIKSDFLNTEKKKEIRIKTEILYIVVVNGYYVVNDWDDLDSDLTYTRDIQQAKVYKGDYEASIDIQRLMLKEEDDVKMIEVEHVS